MRLVTVTIAVVGLASSTATTAFADPGGAADAKSSASTAVQGIDAATLERQAKLDALADLITGTAGTEERHSGGYAGVVVDAEHGVLSVYWKGAVPQQVRDVQAEAKTAGLAVTVTDAKYSAEELEAARANLEKAVEGKPAADVPAAAWNSIAVEPDGSGLFVTYNSSAAPQARSAGVSAAQVTAVAPDAFASNAQVLAGVPVRAAVAAEQTPLYGRAADSSPYYGGARIYNSDAKFCSTGFGGRYAGSDVLLGASHCGTSGNFYNGAYNLLGAPISGGYNLGYDVTFVRIFVGSAGANYYDGAWNDPGYNKRIETWTLNHVGDSVCTSGAMSGIHCGIKVKYAGVDSIIEGITRHNVVQALRTTTNMASAKGDSGGPVVACGATCDMMQARGIISGSYGNWVVCPVAGVGTAGSTECFEGVSYIGMSAFVNNLGFTLFTWG
ncbi:hypothetical protein [Dactylosporangium sp. NPDC051484]|uniref:hypothetical protein n=1 Tax=Dactylosporangium sp. NPDC051484 TaxID=3154942 RepID=UPI00344E3E1B